MTKKKNVKVVEKLESSSEDLVLAEIRIQGFCTSKKGKHSCEWILFKILKAFLFCFHTFGPHVRLIAL